MGVLTGWRHCPRCGSPLAPHDGCVDCDACGFVHYASSFPTVSAFVLDGADRILLARRAFEPDAGLWDVPGGFLEEGEEPLAGLRRELLEETGLSIEIGDFVGAFIDTYGEGPEANALLNLVWDARITGGDPAPADDVSELRWFPRDALPPEDELAFRWLAPSLRALAARAPAVDAPKGR